MSGGGEVGGSAQTIEKVQHEVLSMIAAGAELEDILERLILDIEAMSPEMIGSVLQLDREGLRVRHATGPNLPDAYLRAIDGSPIGPNAGSCGTAAYLRRRVVVEDIATDPLWDLYRSVALPFGLRACWSEPILAASGKVLGTFAMYYRAPRAPTERDLELITVASRMAAIAMERKMAEEALAESEKAYRTIYERSPIGIVSVDEQGRFLRANPAFCRMTGYTEEELQRMRFADLTHPDDLAQSHEFLRKMQAGEIEAFEFEKRYLRRDGSELWARLRSSTVTDSADGRILTVTMVEDIDERKRAEAALRASEEKLRHSQKMEAVGQLAGGIAHDFNNLLTVIGVCSDFVLEALPADSPLRHHVEQIRKAGETAATLTRQLLAFSRRQVLAPKTLDLAEVVAGLVPMLRRLLGEHIAIECIGDCGAATTTRADPGQIEQVIVNLAVNARDAMPRGGTLRLVTEAIVLDEEGARPHAGARPGPYVRLSVIDDGVGMDAATVERIFEPFFTTKEPGKGTGLGLSTVYGIVEQSGGFITVSSEPGAGSTFRLHFPSVSVGRRESAPPLGQEGSRSPRGTETILLVEDDEDVRSIARDVLELQGYRVLVAEEGETALGLAAMHPGRIDLLLTDLVMPGISGREVAEALAIRRPETRVLFMSGYTDDAIVLHGIGNEAAAFLQKPFTPTTLAKAVREALESGVAPASGRS